MVWLCLTLALVSFLVAAVLAALLVRFSPGWGWIDRTGLEPHKKHLRSVPNTGGMAILGAVVGPMAICLGAVWMLPTPWWQRFFPAMGAPLEGLQDLTLTAAGILVALILLHVLGLADDRRGMDPWHKLLGQLIVSATLVHFFDMRVLHFLENLSWWGYGLSTALSLFWIVTIINAFNLLDNMDGLAGGVGAIIASVYLVAALLGQQWLVAALAALLLGALLGFLLFNFPPAKMFMGDSGSLVVGLLLAVISIRTTYFHTDPLDATSTPGHWYGVLMPLMVMAIPLYDLASVVTIRLLARRNPLMADRSHFSHRLVNRGFSPRRAILLIWLCTVATGLSAAMLGSLQSWQAMVAAVQTIAIVVVVALLEVGSEEDRNRT